MSSEVKANKLSPATGTALQISDSGDTTTIPSGATLAIASGATIANSGTATGFGKVLQVVSSGEINGNENTSSTSFIDSGITVTITPQFNNSNILVNAFFTCMVSGASRSRGAVQMKRTISGSSSVLSGGIAETLAIRESSAGASTELLSIQPYQYYDSPATTSAVTYTIQYKLTGGSNIYLYGGASSAPKNIVAMEIAG